MGLSMDRQAYARLEGAVRNAMDLFGTPRPILNAMAIETVAWIHGNFKQGGTPAWTPLRPSTIAARRLSNSPGGAQPLRDTGKMERSVDMANLTDNSVEIRFNDHKAVWHHYGTKPYEIRPKHAKALAIPTSQRTLAGLGRASPTGRGGFVLPPGQSLRGRSGGQTVAPFENLMFRQHVNHPGLPARPLLPTPEQILPKLIEAAEITVRDRIGTAVA